MMGIEAVTSLYELFRSVFVEKIVMEGYAVFVWFIDFDVTLVRSFLDVLVYGRFF